MKPTLHRLDGRSSPRANPEQQQTVQTFQPQEDAPQVQQQAV
jgi:hypothetical protein